MHFMLIESLVCCFAIKASLEDYYHLRRFLIGTHCDVLEADIEANSVQAR